MKSRLRFALITLATLAGMATTIALGRWQLDRAAQKETLQARMDAQGGKFVVDTALLRSSADPQALLHQPALLRGQWLPDQTLYLDNRQMHARVGFFVVTPLRLEGSQRVIMVQRGWVPRNFAQRDMLPDVPSPAGVVNVEGRLAPQPGKLFELGTPATGAIRQNLDLGAFQAQTGLPLLPVLLVQTGAPSEGLLRDWPAINLGVEKHYGYALQWFGMAAVMALLYLWYQFVRPYLHRKDATPHA